LRAAGRCHDPGIELSFVFASFPRPRLASGRCRHWHTDCPLQRARRIEEMRTRAEEIARGVKHVSGVVNNLTVPAQ
jgi:hypothetical protein